MHYRHTSEILRVWVQTTVIKQESDKVSRNLFAGGVSCLRLVKKKTQHLWSAVEWGVSVHVFRICAKLSFSSQHLQVWLLNRVYTRACVRTHSWSLDSAEVRGAVFPHGGKSAVTTCVTTAVPSMCGFPAAGVTLNNAGLTCLNQLKTLCVNVHLHGSNPSCMCV